VDAAAFWRAAEPEDEEMDVEDEPGLVEGEDQGDVDVDDEAGEEVQDMAVQEDEVRKDAQAPEERGLGSDGLFCFDVCLFVCLNDACLLKLKGCISSSNKLHIYVLPRLFLSRCVSHLDHFRHRCRCRRDSDIAKFIGALRNCHICGNRIVIASSQFPSSMGLVTVLLFLFLPELYF